MEESVSLDAVMPLVLRAKPLPQRLQRQILGGGLVGILPWIAEFAVDHVHQALQIPAVQGDRSSPFIRLDLAVEPECLSHRTGMPLQFPQFIAGDQNLVADVSASRFHGQALPSESAVFVRGDLTPVSRPRPREADLTDGPTCCDRPRR